MACKSMTPTMLQDRVYHCALDDTIDVLEEINLKADELESIFDVDVMALLKQFHDRHGAKFSLYLFYEKLGAFNLSEMTDRFRGEWRANSDWLRLSFHAKTKKPGEVGYYRYHESDYQTAKDDFHIIKREILRFAGPECWDNYPRTHFWSGSREAVRAWRDCGVGGLFFGPGHPSLYFDEETLERHKADDFLYDDQMGMLCIRTNVQLPCGQGLTVVGVKEVLAGLENNRIIEIFADDYNVLDYREQMETAIAWAVDRGFKAVFYDEVFGGSTEA